MRATSTNRWAAAIAVIVHSEDDIQCLADWARHSGHSIGSLRGWCALVNVSAKASLDFGRVLRVVVIANAIGRWAPRHYLLASDIRTLDRLFARGHIQGYLHARAIPAVGEFIRAQRFVTDAVCIEAVLGRERPNHLGMADVNHRSTLAAVK